MSGRQPPPRRAVLGRPGQFQPERWLDADDRTYDDLALSAAVTLKPETDIEMRPRRHG